MAPMPAGQYDTREELLERAKEWAEHQGYAVVINRSRFNRLWLKCDRGGLYENRRNLTPDQRKRKRVESRLVGCPFKIVASHGKNGVWKCHTEIPEHTHGPSDDMREHPTLRRMTEEQTQKVNEMTDAENTPAETMEELKRLWPGIKVLTRDIYNARKKYKTQKEEAEAVAGLPEEQSYEDPNDSFPGPTPNGRWEWVPDGEEVTNKLKKRKRRSTAQLQQQEQHQSLDPQLQSPSSSDPSTFRQDSLSDYPRPPYEAQLDAASTLPQHHHTLASNDHLQQPTLYTNTLTHTHDPPDFPPDTDSDNYLPQAPYPNHPTTRQHPLHRPFPSEAIMTTIPHPPILRNVLPSQMDPTTSGMIAQTAAKTQSAQVLMSRIERMEKEQRDQKEMLAQILGAVKGIAPTGGR